MGLVNIEIKVAVVNLQFQTTVDVKPFESFFVIFSLERRFYVYY